MNTKEYISSGIIESYILGLASAEERTEFEAMCRQYPEVEEARIAFEVLLEKQATETAIQPPVELKQKIFSQITAKRDTGLRASTPVRSFNWLRYAAAASIILFAGSLYWSISLFNRNKKLQDELTLSEAKLNDMENDMKIIQQNPNIKMTAMRGTDISPQSYATIYWDTTSKDVYLVINNLPKPPSDKQYQLWALLDGKPIDLGMVENEHFIAQKKLLVHMKNVQGAEAFAITLEKLGGNPTPQGKMYAMGKL